MIPQNLETIIQTISLSGFATLFVYWVLVPFIPTIVDYFKGKLTQKSTSEEIEKNLMRCFEGNHFSDFKSDIAELKRDNQEIKERLLKIEIKLDK